MVDLEDPNIVHVYEEWRSPADVRAHQEKSSSKELISWLQTHGLETFAVRHTLGSPISI
jgi:quinol monooxygenase YgiN